MVIMDDGIRLNAALDMPRLFEILLTCTVLLSFDSLNYKNPCIGAFSLF